MMAKTKSLFLLVCLKMLLQISDTEGASILAGPLAGPVVTSILLPNVTTHHFHNDSIMPPNQAPLTTIERGATFANGCYKQIIKEADITDTRRFIQTEQLICPSGINASSITVLTNQLQQPVIAPVPTFHTAFEANRSYAVPPNAVLAPNITLADDMPIAVLGPPSIPAAALPTILTQQKNEPDFVEIPPNTGPADDTPIAVLRPPSIPAAAFPTILTQQKNEPEVEMIPVYHPNRPVVPPNAPAIKPPHLIPIDSAPIAVLPIPSAPLPAVITQQKNEPSVMSPSELAQIPTNATSQVVTLSKKVVYYDREHKTNAANTLSMTTYNANCLIVFVLIKIFSNFI